MDGTNVTNITSDKRSRKCNERRTLERPVNRSEFHRTEIAGQCSVRLPPRLEGTRVQGPTINNRSHKYSMRVRSRLKVIYWNVDIRSRAWLKLVEKLVGLCRPYPPLFHCNRGLQVSTSHRELAENQWKGCWLPRPAHGCFGGSCFKEDSHLIARFAYLLLKVVVDGYRSWRISKWQNSYGDNGVLVTTDIQLCLRFIVVIFKRLAWHGNTDFDVLQVWICSWSSVGLLGVESGCMKYIEW